MELTQALVLFCLGIFFYLIFKKSEASKFIERFSGPMMFPLIGNIWYFVKSEELLENLTSLQSKYGNRVALTCGTMKALALFHPDDIRKILAAKEMNKSRIYDLLLTDWMGSSILFAKGKDYFEKRKMMQPAFDFKHVDNLELNFNNHSKILVNILKTNQISAKVTEIHRLFTLCTLDMATQYILGKSMNCLIVDNEYAAAVNKETKYVSHRLLSPWLWPEVLWKMSPTGRKEKKNREFLHDLVCKIVRDRKEEMLFSKPDVHVSNSNGEFLRKEKSTLLDLFIREQIQGRSGITDEYICKELNAIIFAGHDGAAPALTFAVYLLATHPEEQAKLHLELDAVFGEDRDRNIEWLDLPKLSFLECCIKEALRLYPPATVHLRAIDQAFQLDDKITIPKGIELLISPWVTHRMSEFFPEPEKFKPSRFLPENCTERHPYAYIPFSGGARKCMGQTIAIAKEKCVLAHIFRNFSVELESPEEKITLVGEMVLHPKNGLNIKLKLREL